MVTFFVSDNRHAFLANILEECKPPLCVCVTKLDPTSSDFAVLPQNSGYEIACISRKDSRLGAGLLVMY